MHRAVACAGPDPRRGGRPDPDRVTRMTRMLTVAAMVDRASVRGRPDPVQMTRTLRGELVVQRIRRSHPSPERIRPIDPPLETHPHRRCEGVHVLVGVVPCGGTGLRRQQGRISPETADSDPTLHQGQHLIVHTIG